VARLTEQIYIEFRRAFGGGFPGVDRMLRNSMIA
jgi:hypothetical protein